MARSIGEVDAVGAVGARVENEDVVGAGLKEDVKLSVVVADVIRKDGVVGGDKTDAGGIVVGCVSSEDGVGAGQKADAKQGVAVPDVIRKDVVGAVLKDDASHSVVVADVIRKDGVVGGDKTDAGGIVVGCVSSEDVVGGREKEDAKPGAYPSVVVADVI